jgi:hypothetical protein
MAHIELRVALKHDLPASEMHALAIDCLMETFQVTDDMGITVLDPSYLGEEFDRGQAIVKSLRDQSEFYEHNDRTIPAGPDEED